MLYIPVLLLSSSIFILLAVDIVVNRDSVDIVVSLGSVDIIEWECSIVDIVDSGGWWLVYILVSIVPIDIIDSLISVDILDSKRSLDFIVSLFRFVDIVDLWISTTIVDSL